MRYIYGLLILLMLSSCYTEKAQSIVRQVNWESKKSSIDDYDDLSQGKSYLPIYSNINYVNDSRSYELTVTVSIRNISPDQTAYIMKADYYNTDGNIVREYLQYPIFLNPLETLEIVISESDIKGGSGANFLFEWSVENEKNPPLFEAVMISTSNQQGLSFLTRGIQIYD